MATNETTIVPTELLRTLLDGWAKVTARGFDVDYHGRSLTATAEVDAAYCTLRDLIDESDDLAGLADFLVSEHKSPRA